jgi:hypothetical protein
LIRAGGGDIDCVYETIYIKGSISCIVNSRFNYSTDWKTHVVRIRIETRDGRVLICLLKLIFTHTTRPKMSDGFLPVESYCASLDFSFYERNEALGLTSLSRAVDRFLPSAKDQPRFHGLNPENAAPSAPRLRRRPYRSVSKTTRCGEAAAPPLQSGAPNQTNRTIVKERGSPISRISRTRYSRRFLYLCLLFQARSSAIRQQLIRT